jgi:hypothetical protein
MKLKLDENLGTLGKSLSVLGSPIADVGTKSLGNFQRVSRTVACSSIPYNNTRV